MVNKDYRYYITLLTYFLYFVTAVESDKCDDCRVAIMLFREALERQREREREIRSRLDQVGTP